MAGHVAYGEKRNAYRIFVGKREGKRPLGRTRHRWEDNIKMDFREIGRGGMGWTDLTHLHGTTEDGFSLSRSWKPLIHSPIFPPI
jgi:hypothetical protein